MFKLPDMKITVLGSCGKEHTNFEEWQGCEQCKKIAADHNKTGKSKAEDKMFPAMKNTTEMLKEEWNAALDKAIEVCNKYESHGAVYEIRTLKK